MSKYDGLGLTDEEISAMEEELTEGEQVEGDDAEVVEEDEPKEDEDTPDADEDDAGEAEPEKVDDEPEPEAKPVEKVVEAKEKEVEAAPAPQVPSKVDELKAELAAVKKKFDDGEISVDEYIEERSGLDRAIVKAELKAELSADKAAESWSQSQAIFLGQNAYLRDNDVIYDAFAMQVNKLLADPKSASLSDEALLAAAKQKVDAAFGIKPTEPSKKKDESPVRDAKKEAADRSKAPKTLQGVPSAAPADDVDQSPFAYLDRLSGDKLEAALSKLSDEDQTRWAHSR